MSLFNTYPFFHNSVERFIVAFGELFTGITFQKRDGLGVKFQSFEVPIEYAPKNKWISRLREQPDLAGPQVKITLPRMAYEMVDLRYAPERKIGVNGQYVVGNNNGMRGKIFPPAPYDVIFKLYVATKDSNDDLQVLEQIIPYFQPYLTLNYVILPEYNITKDVPITLDAYQVEDTFEGSPDEQRVITQEFTFSAQMDFFGPTIVSTAVIKEMIIRMGQNPNLLKPNINIDVAVSPRTATITDSHSITTIITETI